MGDRCLERVELDHRDYENRACEHAITRLLFLSFPTLLPPQYVFPLLYILVKRHMQIIKLAQRVAIQSRDLEAASRSIEVIEEAAYQRSLAILGS